jgi:hypothetical protein
LISVILWINNINNMPLLHINTVGGFVCLGIFYKKVFEGFIDERIIDWTITAFFIFTVGNSILVQPIFTLNTYALIVESMLVTILSLSTFILMMNELVKQKHRVLTPSLTWINSALLLSYSSNLIMFYYSNSITHFLFHGTSLRILMLHSFISMLVYICIVVGLLCRPKV